ncbi:hypothetical protein ACQ4PT_072196 [Festuca glaucescens]
MRGAAWLRSAIHLFSSQGPASAPPPHLRRLLQQFPFRSPSASSGSWQRSAAWIAPFSSLQVQARSYPGSGWDRPPKTKRHLYVVLGGHLKKGFEIHKLDIDEDDLDGNSRSTGTMPRCLPEPPVVRVGPPIIGVHMQFAALGSSITAIGPCTEGTPPVCKGVTVIYNTKTAELAASNLLPKGLFFGDGCDLAVAVGNKLYAFESYSKNFECPDCTVCFPGGLHCLRVADHPKAAAAADDLRWKWRPLPNLPRFSWSWNNSSPPQLPFHAAHTVHPRGRTIFVSAGGWKVDVGTFAYGTRSGKWKRCGDWVLPFRGPTHYDINLDAWVGLHHLEASNNWCNGSETINGHLCACRVTSAACASHQPPEWKVSRETLFQEDPDWRRISVQLVYMVERREYCLVEHLRQVEEGVIKMKYVLRLTFFLVKYGEDGELITTMAQRPARLYEVPAYDESFDTKAFWM